MIQLGRRGLSLDPAPPASEWFLGVGRLGRLATRALEGAAKLHDCTLLWISFLIQLSCSLSFPPFLHCDADLHAGIGLFAFAMMLSITTVAQYNTHKTTGQNSVPYLCVRVHPQRLNPR